MSSSLLFDLSSSYKLMAPLEYVSSWHPRRLAARWTEGDGFEVRVFSLRQGVEKCRGGILFLYGFILLAFELHWKLSHAWAPNDASYARHWWWWVRRSPPFFFFESSFKKQKISPLFSSPVFRFLTKSPSFQWPPYPRLLQVGIEGSLVRDSGVIFLESIPGMDWWGWAQGGKAFPYQTMIAFNGTGAKSWGL